MDYLINIIKGINESAIQDNLQNITRMALTSLLRHLLINLRSMLVRECRFKMAKMFSNLSKTWQTSKFSCFPIALYIVLDPENARATDQSSTDLIVRVMINLGLQS